MRVRTFLVTMAVLTVTAMPAMALTNVDDPWSPNGGAGSSELNLYEIYNTLYGTSYSATSGAGGMDGAALTSDEVFALLDGNGTASFTARYAGQSQRFGYYTVDPNDPGGSLSGSSGVSGQGVSGDFHHLFDVQGGNEILPAGASPGVLVSGDSPFGFYDTTPIGGSQTWFSQSARNADGDDHMVAYWAPDASTQSGLSSTVFIIAFEDLPEMGDVDYNDLVVQIDLAPVPEPATVGLLLMGLAAIVARRRFTV